MQLQYRINLIGAYEEESGDVITQDGEFLGAWTLLDGAIYSFTPLDGEEPIFYHPFIGALCDRIAEWLKQRSECGH